MAETTTFNPKGMQMTQPTLLLVHGAWHGSWCWEPLSSILTDRGWTVRAVDLPTVHAPNKAELTMTDDADAVAAAIAEIDGPVVVVAHSYGGVPTTQAALDPRVAHIVYIAAFVLDEGESLFDSVGGVAPDWWHIDSPLATAGDEEQPPQQLFYADVPAEQADAASARLLPQAERAFHEKLTQVAWRDKPTTYIITEQDAIFPPVAQEALAARSESTPVRLDTSHSPFLSQPEAVADIIERAAHGAA
ncbi:alpha/beta fold hydrolase [Microbacterium sp. LRZ72]|uniref:alpha/beta hydrolase n=1 Tax=Microbacterium sp. LRZ72 TaxID=2942481 RepID=UPI0029B42430|nr:alpha/beta hydrolase [Microbacterium sp. LRZ72]MDX2377209.1 alpha/beta fold hydrolase [Microbacterium sp. LRZ72]